MTDYPGEADDQRAASDPDHVAGQPNPTPLDRLGSAGDTSGQVPPDSAQPAPDVQPAPASASAPPAPDVQPAPGSASAPPAPDAVPPTPASASAQPAPGGVPSAPGSASAAPSFVAGPPTSGFPGSGYAPGPGYGPPSGYPPPAPPPGRASRSKAGPIVVAAIGLVAVLGIGVAIGNALSRGSSTVAAPASIPASPSQVRPTTIAPPAAAPGKYSMTAIANACDLLDPKPLLKWSATPTPPVHREDRPSGGYGGSLTCELKYTSTSPTDGVTTDEAGMSVLVEFTSAGQPPGYDTWNNVGAAQPGWSTGTIPGLGARNQWRGIAVTDPGPGASYVVDVQDSNVSVEVQVAVHRAPGEDPLKLDDLSAIGQSQVRAVLDQLKQP